MSEEKKTSKQVKKSDAEVPKKQGSRTTSAKKKDPLGEEMPKTSSRTKKKQEEKLLPEPPQAVEANPFSPVHQVAVVLMIVMSVFISICFAFRNDVGIIGAGITKIFFGLFGFSAFLIPFLLLQMALYWRRDVIHGAIRYKYLVAICVMIFSSIMVHTIYCIATDASKAALGNSYSWESMKAIFTLGTEGKGGGLLGGFLSAALICGIGYPGTILFDVLFLTGFLMALFGLTPMECIQRIRFYSERSKSANAYRREQQRLKKEAREETWEQEWEEEFPEEEQPEPVSPEPPKKTKASRKEASRAEKIDRSVFAEDVFSCSEEVPKKEKIPVIQKETIRIDGIKSKKTKESAPKPEEQDLSALYEQKTDVNEEGPEMPMPLKKTKTISKLEKPIKQETEPVQETSGSDIISILPPEMSIPAPDAAEDGEEAILPKKKEYQFPPIALLAEPAEANGDEDVSAELRENADRMIQALDSFHVKVNISNVSRGPTITRYEIEPAPGTRVRSILNLLDDIALSLAVGGVRSDGVIAGKSAIGIEVPNKTTNMVYARELLEDSRFESAKSKLTVALGMDVSGAPVYFDVVKMPHLLIAGATGQGKSVCINSLIVSLLYKARPDEVKLILIDPKKVELAVYNGLPHLLVPVVFDPKKAAGSLHWAVQEMERRFELIEACRVRNIDQYNNAIADDPTKERLSQVVIIIDELADLMMSAPDDVETSICRLAQKARAAGMHLIIGTQRPSTDVITGLIKANIPSRIAFTVSNQIDSRIIIDTQGAEKLIGKGDMLFSPVGSSKPVRVQGAYVSEKEIEEIVEFIKEQKSGNGYSDEVMQEIEKNAASCGQKKGKPAESELSDVSEGDPMLKDAIELALESGKISTSLIQRRLSLGYGRAAKLIDMMEKRGIVSPPEGQKPRTVLISREQYEGMTMSPAEQENTDDIPFDTE